ncbi:AAA family ATPase [Bacteroides stercoris]|uniref:AAA family ATPase n=1 Tax=Bacteroides stercoris TaxID=46506 RepID=UPI0021658475|nr:AAA family ATPase [Bacteroides stercoris]MCS3036622.1 AAA family ATPase [Bacteroides stercoris]
MKGLTRQDKDNIRDALMGYCENFSSRNRASESLQGVSAAVVSQILNTKYESISDDMFSRIAAQIGFSFEHWTICESDNYRLATYVLADAQTYKNVTWMVGDAGCGKTTAAIEFRRTHRNVFYILCSEDMRRSDFVREIAKQVGAPTDSTNNLRDMLDYALGMIGFLQNPLLIFDEGDKLTDCVLNYFISIYNRLEGRAGIVFMSTDYIKRRVDNGLRYNKKGYKEINSRIGRKFFDLNATSRNDIYAICQANGLTNEAEIKRVMKDVEACDNDLRRVKRVVHAQKRRAEQQKGRDEE